MRRGDSVLEKFGSYLCNSLKLRSEPSDEHSPVLLPSLRERGIHVARLPSVIPREERRAQVGRETEIRPRQVVLVGEALPQWPAADPLGEHSNESQAIREHVRFAATTASQQIPVLHLPTTLPLPRRTRRVVVVHGGQPDQPAKTTRVILNQRQRPKPLVCTRHRRRLLQRFLDGRALEIKCRYLIAGALEDVDPVVSVISLPSRVALIDQVTTHIITVLPPSTSVSADPLARRARRAASGQSRALPESRWAATMARTRRCVVQTHGSAILGGWGTQLTGRRCSTRALAGCYRDAIPWRWRTSTLSSWLTRPSGIVGRHGWPLSSC